MNISDVIVFQSSQVLQIRLGFIKKAGKKGANRDVIERYDTHKGDIRKIRHSGPGMKLAYGIYEWFSSQENTLLHIIIVIIKTRLSLNMLFSLMLASLCKNQILTWERQCLKTRYYVNFKRRKIIVWHVRHPFKDIFAVLLKKGLVEFANPKVLTTTRECKNESFYSIRSIFTHTIAPSMHSHLSSYWTLCPYWKRNRD